MADRDRLRALEVRVPGHGRLGLGLGEVEHDVGEREDCLPGLRARILDVEAERGCDLVVARASGVDLGAERPEQALDRRVNVLVLLCYHVNTITREQALRLRGLGVGEDPRRRQAPRMERGRPAVVGKELRVLGPEELPDLGGQAAPDAAGPERHTSASLRSLAAASSTSSAAIWMKPSAAACGKVSPVAYEASVSA